MDSFNFERVFDEYTTWVGRDNTTGPSGRAVARASAMVDRQESKGTVLIAWERLIQQDLLTAIETSGMQSLGAALTLTPPHSHSHSYEATARAAKLICVCVLLGLGSFVCRHGGRDHVAS